MAAGAGVQLLLETIKPRYSVRHPTTSPTVCVARFRRGERVHDALRCQQVIEVSDTLAKQRALGNPETILRSERRFLTCQ